MSICGLRCRCPLYGDAIMEQQCSFFILRVFRGSLTHQVLGGSLESLKYPFTNLLYILLLNLMS